MIGSLPASATVHEIVGQWCSGHDDLNPTGITGGSNAANFARPLVAKGFVGEPFFEPSLACVLIPFNYDHPAAKVIGTGVFIQVDTLPDVTPVFIELIEPDPDHPAIAHCVNLQVSI
jgi:hypothetical protein